MTLSALVIALGVAVFPVAASAALSPTLTLNESAGNAAASTSSVGFAINFNSTSGDAVKDASIGFPPGLLIDEEIDGGACLNASGPVIPCQIGAGNAVISGVSTPMALYLIKPPAPTALAGIELVAGTTALVGDLVFRSSSNIGISPSLYVGEEIQFNGLPPAPVTALNFTLTGLTLPSSCRTDLASVSATSQQDPFAVRGTAPFAVSGCDTLAYSPAITTSVARRDKHSADGVFLLGFSDPTGDSTSETVKIVLPASLSLTKAMNPCLNGATCTVGTINATSPILPASQLTGTITLSGTPRSPALGIVFNPPVSLQLPTTVAQGLAGNVLSLPTLPDMPLNSFNMSFTGNSLGRMLTIQCYQTTFGTIFTPWSGAPGSPVNTPLKETGCHPKSKPGKPSASVSLTNLSAGTPDLSVKARKGNNAPGIKSLSVGLPKGLSFAASALHHHRLSKHGLSLSGARLASARIRGGALVLRFKRSTAKSSLSLHGPLLVETASLQQEVASHHLRFMHLSVRINDGRGRQTKMKLTVRVR